MSAGATAASIAAPITYIQRQPRCAATTPPTMRAKRMPRKSAVSIVPTARPRSFAGASSATSGMIDCAKHAEQPMTNPAAAAVARFGAAAAASSATMAANAAQDQAALVHAIAERHEEQDAGEEAAEGERSGSSRSRALSAPNSAAIAPSIGVW